MTAYSCLFSWPFPASRSLTTYDRLNRLIQAQTTQNHSQYPNAPWWGQAYTYDGFSNLLAKTPAGPGNSTTMSLSVDPNTNHFTASGYAYDANGNITSLPQSQGNLAVTYDVENRFQTSGSVYLFDMENQPMTGDGYLVFYDLNGRRLRHESIGYGVHPDIGWVEPVYTLNDRNIYFGGRMIQSNSKTVLVDRLGSVRADETGAKFEYFPYGEEMTLTPQGREKFATYTRSSANGLDYAINRWYDSVHGNFITADRTRHGISKKEPLSWNGYAYVQGDPINRSDPTGQFESIDPDFCDNTSSDPACLCYFENFQGVGCIYPFGDSSGEPEGPGPASFQTPIQCSITLQTRSVAHTGSIANHTYLDVSEVSAGLTLFNLVLEGGAQYPHNFLKHPRSPWGNLVGFVEPVPPPGTPIEQNTYFLGTTNPYTNLVLGWVTGGFDLCSEITSLRSAIANYNGTGGVPYALVPAGSSRNSNSFTYTLLHDIGLANTFSPNVFTPGWGLLVPGLDTSAAP